MRGERVGEQKMGGGGGGVRKSGGEVQKRVSGTETQKGGRGVRMGRKEAENGGSSQK